jgi:hypothetical protein
MPVSIYRTAPRGDEDATLASLGDDEWSLPELIGLLETWLDAHAGDLSAGEYVADVGFCWRRDARGGGSALGPELLKKMGEAGFSLFLSEYPGFCGEEGEQGAGDM